MTKCWDCGERTGIVPAVDDHRQESWREFGVYGDIEHCAYPSFTEPAEAWAQQADQRMRRLALTRRPVTKTGDIKRICVRCANRWRPFLKRKSQAEPRIPEWTPAW